MRLGASYAILYGSLMVTCGTLLHRDPFGWYQVPPPQSIDVYRELKLKDPPPGSYVSLPIKDMNGLELFRTTGTKPSLIVALGDCTGCSLKQFEPSKLDTEPFETVILVLRAPSGEVRKRLKPIGSKWRIHADPKGVDLESLNPIWTPRFYLASPDRRLLDVQTSPAVLPNLVRPLKGGHYEK